MPMVVANSLNMLLASEEPVTLKIAQSETCRVRMLGPPGGWFSAVAGSGWHRRPGIAGCWWYRRPVSLPTFDKAATRQSLAD